MTLEEILATLYHPGLKQIEPGLERMEKFLGALGNPHLSLPRVVHIAGTNGKGSTLAFLRAMAEAAGLRVHVYTSPHLVRFHERIVLAGREIDDALLTEYLLRVQALAKSIPVTFFEATTAAAFLAFAEHPADVVLLETGMGGRLDATNVVPTPVATLITPIGYDHMEYLGSTLKEIAFEKAGIMKPGVPCFAASQEVEAADVLRARAEEVGCGLYWPGAVEVPVALAGEHQRFNAGLASACAAHALNLPRDCIEEGLLKAAWPGRLQKLQDMPELWLDGAHNVHGAQALAEWLASFKGDKPLHLICGMMARKDAEAFLAPLAPYITHLTAVPIPGEEEAMPPQHLCQVAEKYNIPSAVAPSFDAAVHTLPPQTRGVICGSLYLAGHVLSSRAN